MESRVLKNGENRITNSFANHTGWARGVDVVKPPANSDAIIAHSDGTVIKTMVGQVCGKNDPEGFGYGNYIILNHGNNYCTLYAHLGRVDVKVGDRVKQGDVIGYMGYTGNCVPANVYGTHLHFEVRRYYGDPATMKNLQDKSQFVFLDPTPFLTSNLPVVTMYRVQTNAFRTKFFAKREFEKLKGLGYHPISKKYADGLIHIQTGAYTVKSNAEAECARLVQQGFNPLITTEDGQDITL